VTDCAGLGNGIGGRNGTGNRNGVGGRNGIGNSNGGETMSQQPSGPRAGSSFSRQRPVLRPGAAKARFSSATRDLSMSM